VALAWSTVALLVLLLPGFFFFVGLTFPENFTRETTVKNPLGQLAAVVSVSLVVHSLLLWRAGISCSAFLPCVDLEYVLAALQLSQHSDLQLHDLAANLSQHNVAVLAYLTLASGAGASIGWVVGSLVVNRKGFRRLAEHSWIYDLTVGPQSGFLTRLSGRQLGQWVSHLWKSLWSWSSPRGFSPLLARQASYMVAFVLTDIKHEGRQVLYRGHLLDFSLGPDGRFSYLVIGNPHRYYMVLKDGEMPLTTKAGPPIGSTQHAEAGMRRDLSLLVIEGRNIVNAVFERYVIEVSRKGEEALKLALQTAKGALTSVPPEAPPPVAKSDADPGNPTR